MAGMQVGMPASYRRFNDPSSSMFRGWTGESAGRASAPPPQQQQRSYSPTPRLQAPRPVSGRTQPAAFNQGAFNGIWSSMKGAMGPEPKLQGPPEHVAAPSMGSAAASEAAQYGQAKDMVGANTRAALNQSADEFSARGLSGSGLEGASVGQILAKGQGQLGEAARSQAIEHLKREDAYKTQAYQGGISQRGQDTGFIENSNNVAAQNYRTKAGQVNSALEALRALYF